MFKKRNIKNKTPELISIQPKRFNDAKIVVQELKKGNSLVVDFDDLENKEILRIIDFISGSLYGMDGKHQKLDEKKYLFSPDIKSLKKFTNSLY